MKIRNYKYYFLQYILLSIALGTISFTYAIENNASTDIVYKTQNDGVYNHALDTKNVITNSTISPIVAQIDTTQHTLLPLNTDIQLQQDVLAQDDVYTIGVGAGLSTLGGQIAITGPLNDDRSLVWRIIYNDLELYGIQEGLEDDGTFDITTEFTDPKSTLTANIALEFNSTGLIFDWHPWVDGFALSLGIVKNNFDINITASSESILAISQEVTVSNTTQSYSVDANIAASTSLDINYADQYVPYIGIRFSNALAPSWPVSFYLDIGAIHAGSLSYSDIALQANVDDIITQVEADLNKEAGTSDYSLSSAEEAKVRKDIQDNIDEIETDTNKELDDLEDLLTWFPVISIGFQVSF